MKRVLFILTAVSLFSGSGSAQVVLPKKAYMHLSGFVGENNKVTVDLVKINDSIYCDYSLREPGNTPFPTPPGSAGGKMNPDGSFVLHAPFSEEGPVISGRFLTRQTLTGTWKAGKGSTARPFSLSEVYPEGSFPLNVYYQKGSRALIKTGKSPRASIEECLIAPGESSDVFVSDSLQALILEAYGAKNHRGMDPDTVLKQVRDHFFSDYISSNEDLVKQMGLSETMNWELLRMMHVVFNEHRLFSGYILSYAYTGGAHGLEMQEYIVADLRTGKRITLGDLFADESRPALTRMLTARLRQSAGLSVDQKLTENGFFVDEISPTANFYVTGEGVGFYFNHYDIAPYSNGATDIFLTFEELQPVLKPGVIPEALLR